jgi:hypothetical protein
MIRPRSMCVMLLVSIANRVLLGQRTRPRELHPRSRSGVSSADTRMRGGRPVAAVGLESADARIQCIGSGRFFANGYTADVSGFRETPDELPSFAMAE